MSVTASTDLVNRVKPTGPTQTFPTWTGDRNQFVWDLDTCNEESEADLLGFEDLVSEGMSPAEARAVLGPHTALSRDEVADRWGLLILEQEGSHQPATAVTHPQEDYEPSVGQEGRP
jgi:hypothetical protein